MRGARRATAGVDKLHDIIERCCICVFIAGPILLVWLYTRHHYPGGLQASYATLTP